MTGSLVALVAVILLALSTGVLIVRVFLGLLTFALRLARLLGQTSSSKLSSP